MTASIPPSNNKSKEPLANRSWFTLPAPLRTIFEQFPLITYDSNPFPWRTPDIEQHHSLYIWTIPGHSLSPNPGCLKWQAFLLINGIEFKTISSNNHASPSGALPFIQPAFRQNESRSLPIRSTKIPRWVEEITKQTLEDVQLSLAIYQPLIDSSIRNAWLYHLYLIPSNFERVAIPIYIHSQSSSSAIRTKSARDLRIAAEESIMKTRTQIDAQELFDVADAAFKSLSTNLGSNTYFSGTNTPNEVDFSLFAYTHPLHNLMSGEISWQDTRLIDVLNQYQNLIQHLQRIEQICLSKSSG